MRLRNLLELWLPCLQGLEALENLLQREIKLLVQNIAPARPKEWKNAGADDDKLFELQPDSETKE